MFIIDSLFIQLHLLNSTDKLNEIFKIIIKRCILSTPLDTHFNTYFEEPLGAIIFSD